MISGNPVTSYTSRTASPASRIAFAVPPVDSSSTLRAASARASSTSPVLSETDSSARRTGSWSAVMGSAQAVVAQLPAQGGAVDAEHGRGAALVAVAVVEHLHEQRDFQLAQCHLVQLVGIAAIEVAEIAPDRPGDVVAQGRPRAGTGGVIGAIGGVQGLFPVVRCCFHPPARAAAIQAVGVRRKGEASLSRRADGRQWQTRETPGGQRKSKLNATACGDGSTMSIAIAACWPLAMVTSVGGAARYSAGSNARMPRARPS